VEDPDAGPMRISMASPADRPRLGGPGGSQPPQDPYNAWKAGMPRKESKSESFFDQSTRSGRSGKESDRL